MNESRYSRLLYRVRMYLSLRSIRARGDGWCDGVIVVSSHVNHAQSIVLLFPGTALRELTLSNARNTLNLHHKACLRINGPAQNVLPPRAARMTTRRAVSPHSRSQERSQDARLTLSYLSTPLLAHLGTAQAQAPRAKFQGKLCREPSLLDVIAS